MTTPVAIPGAALTVSDTDVSRAESLLTKVVQLIRRGSSGASDNVSATLIPTPQPNPTTTEALELDSAGDQLFVRQLATAIVQELVNQDEVSTVAAANKIPRALGDGTLDVSWGTGGGSGHSLANPPASPDPRDEEFDTDLSNWALDGLSSASAINAYAQFNTGGWRYNFNSLRPSWLMLQSPADGLSYYTIQKSVSISSGDFIWMRGHSARRGAVSSTSNNEGTIGFALSATNGLGVVDTNNMISAFLVEADGATIDVQMDKVEAGIYSGTYTSGGNVSQGDPVNQFEYIGIHRQGSNYHLWVAPPSGQWRWVGVMSFTPTVSRVSIRISNVAMTAPGNTLVGIDFLRFLASAPAPP